MKSTPFQIILLSVFGAAAVVGVLVFAILTSTNTQSTIGPVVIWGTLDGRPINSIIQNASTNNPNFAKVTYIQKDPTTYDDDLTRALAAGTGPDLILLTQDQVVRDASELSLIPYTEVTKTQYINNIFVDAAEPFMLHDGIAALPLLADPLVMYWNKDLFSSVGLSEPPHYWTELFTPSLQTLNTYDDSHNVTRSLIAFGGYTNVDHAKDIVTTLITQAGGTLTQLDPLGRLTATINASSKTHPELGQPTETALRFYTEFADASKSDYSWNRAQPTASQAFIQGNLALYFGYASEQSSLSTSNPNLSFAVARIPQSTNSSITTARMYALGVAKTSHNPVGAKAIAYSLVDKSFSSAIANGYDMISPRRDVLQQSHIAAAQVVATSTVNDAFLRTVGSSTSESAVLVDSVATARTWRDPNPLKTNDLFRTMIEDVTSGSTHLSEAVGRAQSQLSVIIEGTNQ